MFLNNKFLTLDSVVFKINSNKGCFWIYLKIIMKIINSWLTVTKVVFEYVNSMMLRLMLLMINSNKGCFWIIALLSQATLANKINSNKGCFWIGCLVYYGLGTFLINSNKGCFWIITFLKKPPLWWEINSNKGCFWI